MILAIILPAFIINARAFPDFSNNPNPDFFIPNLDTIYQIDTVFQYEYIYDTVFYYDSVIVADTTINVSNNIEESDTATIIKQTYDILITEKRTIYADKNQKKEDFQGRDFSQNNNNTVSDPNFTNRDVKIKPPKIDKHHQTEISQPPPASQTKLLNVFAKDTLYRYDTIVHFFVKFDTVFFENQGRSDTTMSNKIIYQNFGNSVLVKETVSMKVTERKNVYTEKTAKHGSSGSKNRYSNRPRRSSTILSSKLKSNFTPTNRISKQYTNSGSLRIGITWFKPSINYSPRNNEVSDQVEKMNETHYAQNSYGLSFTYLYSKNKIGFETGLGFSQYNMNSDYEYEKLVTDSSLQWEYFNKEITQIDTTWYLNLDTLLQTGDTLLIPNIDSTKVWVTDSTGKIIIDTSFVTAVSKIKYSYSFLEIPIIAHYTLSNKKLSVRVSAGLIPMFLISKAGNIYFPESGVVTNANDITFDFGFALSFYGAAVFGYNLNENWTIFAEPYLKRNLFSIIYNEQIQLKTNSWGIKAGVSYRLFKFKSK